MDAFLLKIALPDLAAPAKWGRDGVKDARRWPLLLVGTMTEGETIVEQTVVARRRFSEDDCRFLNQLKYKSEEEWSQAESDRHSAIWSRLRKLKRRRPLGANCGAAKIPIDGVEIIWKEPYAVRPACGTR